MLLQRSSLTWRRASSRPALLDAARVLFSTARSRTNRLASFIGDSAFFFNSRSNCRAAGATMQTTRTTAMAIGLATMCAAGLTAQTQETKTTTNTKIEIKGGKDVRVTGCLERRPNGDYILTEGRENLRQEPSRYALVTSEDLSRHVGERVEIQGKAVANGDGKVSIESKTKTEVEN